MNGDILHVTQSSLETQETKSIVYRQSFLQKVRSFWLYTKTLIYSIFTKGFITELSHTNSSSLSESGSKMNNRRPFISSDSYKSEYLAHRPQDIYMKTSSE